MMKIEDIVGGVVLLVLEKHEPLQEFDFASPFDLRVGFDGKEK